MRGLGTPGSDTNSSGKINPPGFRMRKTEGLKAIRKTITFNRAAVAPGLKLTLHQYPKDRVITVCHPPVEILHPLIGV